MAGGMGSGDWGTMAERVARTRGEVPEAPVVRHVWINVPDRRHAGLLIGWRRLGPIWQGRVVHYVLHEDEWVPVEEWLDAGLIEKA